MAPLVRTGGSRHTGLAAPPHRNIQYLYLIHQKISYVIEFYTMEIVNKYWVQFVAYIVAFIVSLMLALLIRKTVTSIQRVATITKK